MAVTSTTPAPAATGVAPNAAVSATFASGVTGASLAVSGPTGPVAGAVAYDETGCTVTFTPTDPLAWSTGYTATATAAGVVVTDATWTFTTVDEPPVIAAATIFGDATPQNAAWNDPDSVQVATRFTVNVAGDATGVRFYKGAANTGIHTGFLWRADGQLMGQVTVGNETADGWQEAAFASPIRLEPGVEYRVGLHSTTGRYAVDLNALAAQTATGVFTIPAQGSAYTYSTGFPANLSAHNYWVDVTFVPVE